MGGAGELPDRDDRKAKETERVPHKYAQEMEHTLEFRLLGSRDSEGGGGVGELDMGWWGGWRTDGGSTTDGAAEKGAQGAATATLADTHKNTRLYQHH